jgi:hypothetical protein
MRLHKKQTQFQRMRLICEDNKHQVQERLDSARVALDQERIHMEALEQEQHRVLTSLQQGKTTDPVARSVIHRIVTEKTIVNKTTAMWLVQHTSCLRELHKVKQSVTQLQILESNKSDYRVLDEFKANDFQMFSKSSHNRTLADDKRSMMFDAITSAVETTTLASDDDDDEQVPVTVDAHYVDPINEAVDDIMLQFCTRSLPSVPTNVLFRNYGNDDDVDRSADNLKTSIDTHSWEVGV